MAELQKISDLQLEDLPDEMILKVLSYLNIGDLMRCGRVSKRFGKIRDIESLWQNVDLSYFSDAYDGESRKAVKANFIKFLLDKGCECLNLQSARIKGSLKLDGPSKLKRLNLAHCLGNKAAVKEILNSCHFLQKLALTVIFRSCNFFFPKRQNNKIIFFSETTLWLSFCKPTYFEEFQNIANHWSRIVVERRF